MQPQLTPQTNLLNLQQLAAPNLVLALQKTRVGEVVLAESKVEPVTFNSNRLDVEQLVST